LRVGADQHCATDTVGVFVPGLRGQGLGREITRLVLAWAFGVLGAHRVELEELASNSRAIGCYRACGFRQEGSAARPGPTPRRLEGLHPDGRAAARIRIRSLGHPSQRPRIPLNRS
jgi:RimJ/RimL family protein N-acetyltransferase